MSTNELEIKLKISENTGIHCPTLELAKQVLNIFNDLGLKWCTDVSYIKCTNWDSYENNTVYYPTAGTFSSLQFAQSENYKIISAEEFITLHTEEFNLENYEPEGELIGFPKEIIARMLDCQEEQGNKRDISVFERLPTLRRLGFDWCYTKEKYDFWEQVIFKRNFDLFFEKYPKQEDNQEFRIGDKVYDILCKSVGIITNVNTDESNYQLTVNLENGNNYTYTIDGRINHYYKTPQLLHYRDDYDYTTIDFKNLPKRQELKKRWRAEEGGYYYFINRNEHDFNLDKIYKTTDYYSSFSNEQYKIGNYFKTREQAQEIADQTNTYFQKIVKI